MKYLREYNTHDSYESELNVGGVDLNLPNVSYCEDVKDVHYTPYNLVRFYVGDITGTTPQTVKIYTDNTTFDKVQVSEGNKWYSYVLPKDKGLYKIHGITVKKVAVKADISNNGYNITPQTIVEASFKGSNTSNVTIMGSMFYGCSGLTSLDLSGWDTSNVTNMNYMFGSCSGLKTLDLSGWDMSNVTSMHQMFENCNPLITIRMKGCSKGTIDKIKAVMPSGASISTV